MNDAAQLEIVVEEAVADGIERVSIAPKERSFETPLLFVHGMWHGAWCWRDWQEQFAQMGWETHAFSLPGHGKSPAQKSVRFSGMGYYLETLKAEVQRLEHKPVLIGHSMGGALVQWYLKKVGDDLPAAVLLASWTSHSTWADGMIRHLKRDPWGTMLVGLTLSTTPFIRDPEHAASMLITDGAKYYPDELYDRLCEESAIVLNQHNPPFWRPKRDVRTPMLWLGAERDAVISPKGAQGSAAFYGADFQMIEKAGHNLMMEWNADTTLERINTWLRATVGVQAQ